MKFFVVFAAIVAVAVARPRISAWTLQELSDALQSPQTNPGLVPVLEQALNDLMAAIFAGEQVESIIVPLPADIGILPNPVDITPVLPTPVVPSPVDITPVLPTPVVPSPVEAAPTPAANSPLVQIIINVKGQQQVADVVAPAPVAPEVIPTPVHVVDNPLQIINPEPVIVEEIAPTPVIVAPLPLPVNPIDVIAVNPVDTWGPAGLIPTIDVEDVGPM